MFSPVENIGGFVSIYKLQRQGYISQRAGNCGDVIPLR